MLPHDSAASIMKATASSPRKPRGASPLSGRRSLPASSRWNNRTTSRFLLRREAFEPRASVRAGDDHFIVRRKSSEATMRKVSGPIIFRTPLFRLLVINLALGISVAALLVAGLLWLDLAGLRHLIFA